MNLKKILVTGLCFLCLACTKDQTDSQKFKAEYEQDNENLIQLEISENNIVKYSTTEEVNNLIKSGTGVIYIGSPKDNLSRKAIDILLDVANNTDLEKIYYLDTLEGINGLDTIEEKKLPTVLFLLEGQPIKYHVGTIQDKTDLTEDEVIELYNIYSEGIHEVLQDTCEERC